MRLPPLITAILRERAVCIGFLVAGLVLILSRIIGITVYVCPFQTATGLPCPGCGLTRGTTAIFRGQWHEALAFHPFSPLAIACIILLILSLTLPEPRRSKMLATLERFEQRTAFAYFALAALMGFGLWRIWRQLQGA